MYTLGVEHPTRTCEADGMLDLEHLSDGRLDLCHDECNVIEQNKIDKTKKCVLRGMREQERLDVEVELKLIKERARRPSPCFEQFCSRNPCSPVSRTLSELFIQSHFLCSQSA